MSTATETFAVGSEQDTVVIGIGQTYQINALTAPWNNAVAGSTADQTASIKAQIAAIPDGLPGFPNVIRFPVGKSQGKYFTQGDLANNPRGISGCVLFRNRHHLIIEGPSPTDPATFYTVSPAVPYGAQINLNQQSERRHFWFQGCTDITVRNIRVEGSNYKFANQLANGNPAFWLGGPDTGGTSQTRGYHAPWEAEHGFAFDSCVGVKWSDLQAENVWGDGIYLGRYQTGPTTNVRAEDTVTSLVGTGRQGIAMSDAVDVKISGQLQIGTSSIRCRRAAIDLEPAVAWWLVKDVELSGLVIYPGSMAHIAALGAGKVDDIKIHHGTINGGSGQPVAVGASDNTRRKNWYIGDITWTGTFGSPSAAMWFRMVDNVLIENCVVGIATTQSRYCVLWNRCLGTLVSRNNNWTGGCWVIADINSSVAQLQGFNTFSSSCPWSGLGIPGVYGP